MYTTYHHVHQSWWRKLSEMLNLSSLYAMMGLNQYTMWISTPRQINGYSISKEVGDAITKHLARVDKKLCLILWPVKCNQKGLHWKDFLALIATTIQLFVRLVMFTFTTAHQINGQVTTQETLELGHGRPRNQSLTFMGVILSVL